ncbi:L,D-transpeptidase [Actinomyces naeslundii]
MSSNTSPTGAQHQGEASSSKNPVLSTPYEEPAGVRRQSVFHAAANNTAPHERSTSTDSDDMNEDMGSTEEIEVVAPSAVAAPGTDNELQYQPAPESSTGTEGPATTDDADSDSAAFAGPAAPPVSAFAVPPHSDEESYLDEPRRRRRWPLGVAAAALLLLGVVGAGGYAYAAHYDGRAVPGTTVAGTDVSGKSREQVVAAIENRAKSAKVDISGDVTASASLADLGTTVDAQATADAVMARGDSLGEKLQALVSKGEVPVVTTTNTTTVSSYATSLIPEDRAKARNATVVLSEDGTTFSTTSASNGASLDVNALEQAAQKAATSLGSSSVSLTMTDAAPKVSDDEAQKVADKANNWVSQDVTITLDEESYTAENTDKASWIKVTNSAESAPTIAVDSAKVSQWVQAQAEEAKVEPVTGQRNVNASGKVVSTPTEAKDGKTVNNADTVAKSITESFGSDKAYTGTFETTAVKAEWKERTIAAGAENLPYQAAPGEKWVDLNLSNKTVTAYEGATVVHGPVSIVDGAAETPTVTGTYKVYLQYESQTMRGENADGSPYVAEDVPWVSYFYSGYAFHGAGWRSSFGYSGSHGCVNMPVSEAQWIYNWVDTNTVVQSHY